METQDLLERQRSKEDERKVIIRLTNKGNQLRMEAASTPKELETSLLSDDMTLDELVGLKNKLLILINNLSAKSHME
ncbi:transcriptional regulator, SarA/Rot family [Spirosoma flavum]|uniref:Transcriptional regulator SarA/SarZ/Rot-like helix-turn-helix domain-containing protein n=1 Tax=Spirosoma flavum TaxID=2048557 RepID=A0ABW6AIG5_9BACT